MPKLEMDFHTHLSLLKHIDLVNPNLECNKIVKIKVMFSSVLIRPKQEGGANGSRRL
jgi:hypothetical protein